MICLSGCTPQTSIKEKQFGEIYKNCEMNTLIKISFQKRQGDQSRFDFSVENLSAQEFVFSYKANLAILSFDNDEWAGVSNNVNNFGADELYVGGNDYRIFAINPTASTTDKIRIVVTGKFPNYGNQSDECFGGYEDYTITP